MREVLTNRTICQFVNLFIDILLLLFCSMSDLLLFTADTLSLQDISSKQCVPHWLSHCILCVIWCLTNLHPQCLTTAVICLRPHSDTTLQQQHPCCTWCLQGGLLRETETMRGSWAPLSTWNPSGLFVLLFRLLYLWCFTALNVAVSQTWLNSVYGSLYRKSVKFNLNNQIR